MASYFIHVFEDGTEEIHPRGAERTFTSLIHTDDGPHLVKPRGNGWSYLGLTDVYWGARRFGKGYCNKDQHFSL